MLKLMIDGKEVVGVRVKKRGPNLYIARSKHCKTSAATRRGAMMAALVAELRTLPRFRQAIRRQLPNARSLND